MSRTIKFRIENDKEFTVMQLRRLYNISNFFSNKFEWTLDSFSLGPNTIEPVLYDHLTDEICWSILETAIQNSINAGDHYIDAVIRAVQKGQAISKEPLVSKTYSGEVRVLGNESNARNVIKALSEISIVFPKSTIWVSDEGHYLYTDLIIQRGSAIPDIRWLKSFMHDFIAFITAFKGDVHVKDSDRTMLRYYAADLKVRLKSLNTVLSKLRKNLDLDKIMPADLMNIPQKNWPEVEFYTRNIDLDDFTYYRRQPSNLMGGYFGEYWNLVDIDVEEESYRILSSIQCVLQENDPQYSLHIL